METFITAAGKEKRSGETGTLSELTLSSYSKKGYATADKPKAIEVIGGVKGDVILAKLLGRVKKRTQAQILEVITPSAERCDPRCSHVPICGGCKWQQVEYAAQLIEKKQLVEALFPGHEVGSVIGCQNPWHYRSKMEFTFSQSREGEKFLGLMQSSGRFRVENIQECFIAPTWMSLVLNKVRTWWLNTDLNAFTPHKGEGLFRTLTMRWARGTDAKMVFLTIHGVASDHLTKSHLKEFAEAAQFDDKTSVFLVIQHAHKGEATKFSEMHLAGPSAMEEKLLTQKFTLSPRAFFQPNHQMAERMFGDLIETVKQLGAKKVLDLYCGIGTIGILLAPYVQQVIGVELCSHAICDAKETIEESGLENVQVFCQDAHQFLKEIEGLFKPDLVVVDPPRSGLGIQAIEDLRTLKPRAIVYVSCNPQTQAEDIQRLDEYEILSIQPYDQFPHTPHVENIIVLIKKIPIRTFKQLDLAGASQV